MKAGWQSATLNDLCVVDWGNTNLTKSSYVEDGEFLAVSAAGCDGRIGHKEHTKHTPVLSAIGAQCGKMFFPDEDFTAIKNTITLTPKIGVCIGRFLYYLLTFVELPQRGAGQPFISKGDIQSFPVTYPSLSEQHRIVAILDAAFDGIATAKANAEQNLQNARALFESHLQQVFTERGEGWVDKPLGDCCKFENGDRGGNYPNKSARTESGVPFINAGHLTDDGLDMNSMDFIPKERFDLLGAGKVRPRDILFCLRGSLGKFASVGNLSQGAIASSLVIVRPTPVILDGFVLAYFRSGLCTDMINRFRNGAAQPNLSANSLKQFIVPVPPISEQGRIVGELESLQAETQRLESLYQQKLAALEELKKSLLHQAFSGNL